MVTEVAIKSRVAFTVGLPCVHNLALTMNTLQALAWVVELPLLVAQGPLVTILALAAIGELIEGHTDSMYAPAYRGRHKLSVARYEGLQLGQRLCCKLLHQLVSEAVGS